MLSNCIFDVLKNNDQACFEVIPYVVICFQIVSLTYWKTTNWCLLRQGILLWFAFKLYLWRIEKQLTWHEWPRNDSCDLLSNCIFDVLKNNATYNTNSCSLVVICFQIVSLTYWKTTLRATRTNRAPLWFAFKLYLWRIEKQQYKKFYQRRFGCDLLSNCIFDVLKNNTSKFLSLKFLVVICFQIVSLTYWKTTYLYPTNNLSLLWFAFKLYLWRIEKQPAKQINWSFIVVICFQIVSLTYWKTTSPLYRRTTQWLWFAFKLYLWRIEKQPPA